MKPAWMAAERSLCYLEYRWRQRHDVWNNDTKPRMPKFRRRHDTVRNGEWRQRPKCRPRSERLRSLLWRRWDDLPF